MVIYVMGVALTCNQVNADRETRPRSTTDKPANDNNCAYIKKKKNWKLTHGSAKCLKWEYLMPYVDIKLF